ncbi:MAG TPA: low molecular weight protein-tyrosine-phosphatase [Candidatus Limnocylindrales bacterium]|nr:low molecular weight protein-tyrosine-phosphatase [Candidatus Limnocylindrales bacterium]
MVHVLFVCLGNICRSPTAEGVFRAQVREAGLEHAIHIESAGTHAYHVGEGADPRSVRAARYRGYDLSAHCARPVRERDFHDFDYIVAMDRDNLRSLHGMQAAAGGKARVALLSQFSPQVQFEEVPDPYSRAESGFELVLDIIEEGCRGLLEHIRSHDLPAGRSDS